MSSTLKRLKKNKSLLLQIPKKIKVGPHYYNVRAVENQNLGEKEAGHIDFAKNEIVIDVTSAPNQLLVTLFHEIVHAFNSERGEMDTESLAQDLAGLFLENPGFADILCTFVYHNEKQKQEQK